MYRSEIAKRCCRENVSYNLKKHFRQLTNTHLSIEIITEFIVLSRNHPKHQVAQIFHTTSTMTSVDHPKKTFLHCNHHKRLSAVAKRAENTFLDALPMGQKTCLKPMFKPTLGGRRLQKLHYVLKVLLKGYRCVPF